jgi:hypothetical protein
MPDEHAPEPTRDEGDTPNPTPRASRYLLPLTVRRMLWERTWQRLLDGARKEVERLDAEGAPR